jgi:hypothetical protein
VQLISVTGGISSQLRAAHTTPPHGAGGEQSMGWLLESRNSACFGGSCGPLTRLGGAAHTSADYLT